MFKNYLIKLINGSETFLLARNNREAMKLTGRAIRWYGNVLKVIDDDGKVVIYNEKIFKDNV